MAKSNFKGVFVAADILRDDRLTATDKFLLAYIMNFPDGCFASDKYIAKVLGAADQTIRHSLVKLRRLNLVANTKTDGQRLLFVPKQAQQCAEIGTTLCRNKHNNVPKQAQKCAEISQTQQISDPYPNNNSNTNSSSNGSSDYPDDYKKEALELIQDLLSLYGLSHSAAQETLRQLDAYFADPNKLLTYLRELDQERGDDIYGIGKRINWRAENGRNIDFTFADDVNFFRNRRYLCQAYS